jgi:hypothetical protein
MDTSTPTIFNQHIRDNNREFAGLDKSHGDNFVVTGTVAVVLGVSALVSGFATYKLKKEMDKNKDAIIDDINSAVSSVFEGSEQGADYKEAYVPKPKADEIKNDDFLPDLKDEKPKTQVRGGGNKRARWKDKKGKIYEWDSQHGEFEIYDKQGNHLGSYNPRTKEKKPKVKGRKVEK